MKESNQNLKRRIMNRVFGFWFLRSMIPLFVLELAAVIMGIYLFTNFIFVGKVIDNTLNAALGSPWQMFVYLWSSFWKTRLEVQLVILGMMIFLAFLLRQLNRSIIAYVLMKRVSLTKL